MNGWELFFGVAVAAFGCACLSLVWKIQSELRSARARPVDALGSLGAVAGMAGMALLTLGEGLVLQSLALLLIKLSLVLVLLFTFLVFGQQESWSMPLLMAGLGLAGFSGGLDLTTVTARGIALPSRAHWVGQIATGLPLLWLGCECGAAWVRQRRQRLVGLGDVLVENRFALSAAACGTLVVICGMAAAEGLGALGSSASLGLRGVGYLVLAAIIPLIFTPPRSYRSWVASRLERA